MRKRLIHFLQYLPVVLACQPMFAQETFPSLEGFPPEQIVNLSIQSAAVSKPALRHRLFDNRIESFPRNAAIFYHRALQELRSVDATISLTNSKNPDDNIQTLYDDDNYDNWIVAPLHEFPLDTARDWVERYAVVIEELKRAKASSFCDWQIMPAEGEKLNWMTIRMDDVQGMRAIARMLVVAIRVKLAEGKYEEAIELIEMGFVLAHDTETTNTAIGCLIGIACADMLGEQMVVMIGREDAPNLYWPLLDLPQPLVDSRRAIRNEISLSFGFADNPESLRLSSQGWQELYMADLIRISGMDASPLTPQLKMELKGAILLLALTVYPKAKTALAASGFDEAELEEMPALQVVAIYQKREWLGLRDEFTKLLNLPVPDLMKEFAKTEELIGERSKIPTYSVMGMTVMNNLPAFQQVIRAEIRVQRKLTALRAIEAIRAHIAVTDKLPESLDEITVVPVPNNPVTGKPFPYRITDGVAELADFGTMDFSRRLFRIQLRK